MHKRGALIHFYLLSVLCFVPLTIVAQNTARYRNVPLGENVQKTTTQLKKQGFKVVKTQDKEDDLFYGTHREVFLLGEQDGYPAVVHLEASAKTQTVFRMDVIFRDFIDLDEAVEQGDRLAADEKAKTPFIKWELNQRGAGLIDMPDKRGRITRYLTYPKVSVIYRFFNSQEQLNETYLGCVTLTVWENSLGHEHLVSLDYYDDKAAGMAEKEAGKNWREESK